MKSSNKNIYILIGGGCHTGHAKTKLVTEIEGWLILKKITVAKLLFIPFAKDQTDWEKTLNKYKKSIFSKLLKEKRVSISTASTNPKTLQGQLLHADILFFGGGSELNLKKIFNRRVIPKTDKIIIGTSAGTNFLSKFYFSNDRGMIEAGLGVLPIKTICHFSSEKNEKASLLSLKGGPVFPIGDNAYVTLIF